MSEETESTIFSRYEPQLEKWLRKTRKEIKEKTTDLQVLTNQLSSENKELEKRLEKIEKDLADIRTTLFFLK